MKKIILTIILFTLFVSPVLAQETSVDLNRYKAKIISITEKSCDESMPEKKCDFIIVKLLTGPKKDSEIEIMSDLLDDQRNKSLRYEKGVNVYVYAAETEGMNSYFIDEPVRTNPLWTLTFLFVFIVIIIGGWHGVRSLGGLAISFIIIRYILVPLILSGTNPIFASLIGGIMILIFSLYFSHGFNKKTTLALSGTILSLILTGILAFIFTYAARLTGFTSEESAFLTESLEINLNIKGILLASMIIGGIGILDDITISQISIIQELKHANARLPWIELFKRSMNVGKDHIASLVNTLVLAYTGAALPLILLLIANNIPMAEIINNEIIAEEIVRTLVGSIGLILAVPITSFIGSFYLSKNEIRYEPEHTHKH